MSKIYTVSAERHSDYGVVAYFDSSEYRDEYLVEYERLEDSAFPEEFDLNPPIPTILDVVKVEIQRDGSAVTWLTVIDTSEKGIGFARYSYRGCMVYFVETTDRTLAAALANLRRRQFIAAGVWGKNEATRRFLGRG